MSNEQIQFRKTERYKWVRASNKYQQSESDILHTTKTLPLDWKNRPEKITSLINFFIYFFLIFARYS